MRVVFPGRLAAGSTQFPPQQSVLRRFRWGLLGSLLTSA